MKIKSFLTFGLFLSFLCFVSINSSFATTITHDPIGTYEFTVTDIPDMPDVKGTMVVSREDGVLKVVFKAGSDSTPLDKATLNGHELTGELSTQGIVLKLKGKFNGDSFEGQFNTDFGALGVTAEKQ